MLRALVFNYFPEFPIEAQSPGRLGRWGDVQFIINPPAGPERELECDFCIVHDDITAPVEVNCAAENTLLLTAEPPTLRVYPRRYTRQFAHVITCHRRIRHPGAVIQQQGLPWHVGVQGYHGSDGRKTVAMDRDALVGAKTEKSRLISVISSNRASSRGHRLRLKFVEALKERLGEKVDVFGFGIREIKDKWDAIAPYRFHIAIENSRVADYWTEKLADAYLGRALPIYHGCPNIEAYFPKESLLPINIERVGEAMDAIERAIASEADAAGAAGVAEARELVLNKHGYFPMLGGFVAAQAKGTRAERLTFRPMRSFVGPVRRRLHAVIRRLP